MSLPDFSKAELLPAIVQDFRTQVVLMLGYMNEAAYKTTQETGFVTFYSRSRQKLWKKGETSGHYLKLVEMSVDCDGDAILVWAEPMGPTCHRGTYSCFSTMEAVRAQWGSFLTHLDRVIAARLEAPSATSYTSQLAAAGMARIAQKVGEEATEVIVAALAQSPEALAHEAADLLYHLLVLLRSQGLTLADVEGVLRSRHRS